jgi:hypothetical protein
MLPNRTTCLTWYACRCGHNETSSLSGDVECSQCGEFEVAGTWWRCACEGDFREASTDNDRCSACGEQLAALLASGVVQRYRGGVRIGRKR